MSGHSCNHLCQVSHEFGNVFKCASTGCVHICDANCDQRVYYDRYNSICKLSRKLHPPLEMVMEGVDQLRKRSGDLNCTEQHGKRRAFIGLA